MEENLLRYEPPSGSAFWRRPARGRAVRAVAAAATVGLLSLAVSVDAAATGLGLLALVAAVTAFRRPYLLGPLVALLLPAGAQLDVLQAQVSPLEAAVGGGALGYVARLAARREERRLGMAHWTFAAFLLFVAVSVLGPADTSDQLHALLFWGALAVVFHAVTTHLGSRRDARLLLVAFAVPTLVEAVWALYEYVSRWSERFSLLDGAIVYPLPQGTLAHPNGLAQFLVVAGFAVLALALADRGLARRCGFLAAGAASLALVVTFSRASWIAFAVGASVYLLERTFRRPALVAAAVASGAAAALALLHAGAIGDRISSLFTAESSGLYDFRLELARRAARIAVDHPLTGSGHFAEAGVYAGRPDLATHPHNLLLGLAVFFGIPAALAFGTLVLLALRAAWTGFRTPTGSDRHTAVGFLALLVALLVNGLFEYPFWNPALQTTVVLALAAAVALGGRKDARHEPGRPR